MQLRHLVDDEVDAVVVGIAAQEHEEIAAPVGDAEAEHVGVEFGDLLHVAHAIGDVAELDDVEHRGLFVELGELVFGIEIDRRALGIVEAHCVRHAR